MARRQIGIIWLLVALVAVAASLWLTLSSARMERHPRYEDMLAAAMKMQEAEAGVRRMREAQGIPISPDDVNRTGLIGGELTDITTTVGNLQSKRTSTNPDFAALVVRYFDELGLEAGDRIAVGASGSFPGIMLAVLSACSVTGVEPVIVPSIGASEYGANIPGLTSVEILDGLRSMGIFEYVPVAISLGGAGDTGDGGIIADAKPILEEIALRSGHAIIRPVDVVDSIRERMRYFEEGGEVSAFANIGGAEPNFGSTSASLEFPNGLVLQPPVRIDAPDMGLIYEYANRGVPVMHFLDIKGLALKSGIPVDPMPLPEAGSSMVYYQKEFTREYAMAGIAAAVLALAVLPGLTSRRRALGKKR